MKVVGAEVFHVRLGGGVAGWNPVILRLTTDEGISGVGEIALAYGTGASAGVGMLRDLVEGFVLGADPFRIEALWDTMFRRTFWAQGGGPVVYGGISAIDEALWDIKGKALGVPVYELLGGPCWERLHLYANGWYHNCVAPQQYAEAALRVVEDGYTALKFDPFAYDAQGRWEYPRRALDAERANLAVERVKAVRQAVGPGVDILIEVHGNLGPTAAIQMGHRFEEFAPFFYEEPVDALNVDAMRKVAESVNIPIAAGERLYTRYGFRQYIEQQVVDILQPDLGLAGGITETKKIASYAETYGLHVQPHNCAGPVATAAAVQLDGCLTNFIIQEWFPYRAPETYRLVKEPLEPRASGGYLPIPTAPGLGMELDEAVLSQYERIRLP